MTPLFLILTAFAFVVWTLAAYRVGRSNGYDSGYVDGLDASHCGLTGVLSVDDETPESSPKTASEEGADRG